MNKWGVLFKCILKMQAGLTNADSPGVRFDAQKLMPIRVPRWPGNPMPWPGTAIDRKF